MAPATNGSYWLRAAMGEDRRSPAKPKRTTRPDYPTRTSAHDPKLSSSRPDIETLAPLSHRRSRRFGRLNHGVRSCPRIWPSLGPLNSCSRPLNGSTPGLCHDRSNYRGKLSRLVDHDEMAAIGDLVFWNRRQVGEDIRVGTMLAVDIGRRNRKLMEDP